MTLHQSLDDAISSAAEAISRAETLLIGAGAGMGVDSGLPDFRGHEGFWKAYPPFRGKSFAQLSTPHWFRTDPELAWGFFGHRMNLYRRTEPHAGFQILRRWCARMPQPSFIFTSNVDGHFPRAGFAAEQVLECHGSIGHLQCAANCSADIWPSDDLQLEVDAETIRCRSELPRCRHCGDIARPNILMFGDWHWNDARSMDQQRRYERWQTSTAGCRRVVIELGAGLAVPTVRVECERSEGTLIRINPNEAETPDGGISVVCGALAALTRIDSLLTNLSS
jgi:NAD-dependent SIR2 family protein deacetylase